MNYHKKKKDMLATGKTFKAMQAAKPAKKQIEITDTDREQLKLAFLKAAAKVKAKILAKKNAK